MVFSLRNLAILVVSLAPFLASCGGSDCGAGTVEVDGECRSDVSCGPGTALVDGECSAACGTGTMLMNGECVGMPDGLVCGADTVVNVAGDACVVAATACTSPASFDVGTGRCVSPSDVSCGEGTEIEGSVCVPSCAGDFVAQNPQRDGCVPAYRVQVVHASPDPALSAIDIYSNGRIADDLEFGQATAVFKVPVGQRVGVAPGNSVNVNDTLVLNIGPSAPARVLGVLRGVMGSGFNTSVNDTTLTLDFVEVLEETPSVASDAELLLYHAVPDAPAVSVGRQPSPDTAASSPLFSNVAYGTASAYETAPLGTSALDVYAASGSARVASIQTSSGLAIPAATGLTAGTVGVLVAAGFLDPMANMGGTGSPGASLQVLAVFPDGMVRPLDGAARLQVVHASVEAPASVDVYLAESGATALGTPTFNNLAYQTATPFQSFVSGVPVVVQLTVGSSTAIAASVELDPEAGSSARWVAVGDPVASGATALTVVAAPVASEVAVGSGIDVQVFHASTDAGGVDVVLSPVGSVDLVNDPRLSNLTYGVPSETSNGLALQDYLLSLTAPGNTSVSLVDFNVGLSTFSFASSGDQLLLVVSGSAATAAVDLDLVVIGIDSERATVNGQ
ncbi:MAG: DUF4397 domain-containing protein [Myxococcota bacterium]